MQTIPTFIVGHMSGENWDPVWRDGRDLYRDVVARRAAGVVRGRDRAALLAPHPAVVGWLVSNEMPLYGGRATVDEVTAWARLVVQAVRSTGATQPISLGDGAWGVEVTGEDNGYSLRSLAPLVDFVGPHAYPMQDDQVRQFLTPAFACELGGKLRQAGRARGVRRQLGLRVATRTRRTTTGRSSTRRCSPARGAGSPGTTATSTTSATRTRTATTSSSSTSA